MAQTKLGLQAPRISPDRKLHHLTVSYVAEKKILLPQCDFLHSCNACGFSARFIPLAQHLQALRIILSPSQYFSFQEHEYPVYFCYDKWRQYQSCQIFRKSVVNVSVLTFQVTAKGQADSTSCHLLLTDFYQINSSKLIEELTSFVNEEHEVKVLGRLIPSPGVGRFQ